MPSRAPDGSPPRILVTGAGGQLGRAVVRAAAAHGCHALGLPRADLDVTDVGAVDGVLQALRPHAVVHCAAMTDVDGAEADPDRALAINGEGTRAVATAAASAGAHLVYVSTDYVFPGTAPGGYAEDDEVGPINAYGASKLAGERAARELVPDACIARTAWLFGADGANFVRTIAALATSRPAIDVVADQQGSPTWTVHLADALVLCATQRMGGIVHLAGSPPATWHALAEQVVATLGVECEVRPVASAAFPRPAPRPAHSVLRSTRTDAPLVGDWREGLAATLGIGAVVA